MATCRPRSDTLAGDGAHLASDTVAGEDWHLVDEHLDATWQAPLPGDLKGEHRYIAQISASAPLSWRKLHAYAELHPPTATLAEISWRTVMNRTWEQAFKQCAFSSAVRPPAGGMKAWSMILETLGSDTLDGFKRYVLLWAQDDAHVADVMEGSKTSAKATADIGAWLADFFYTQFLTLRGD